MSDPVSAPSLPSKIAKLASTPGVHRRGFKILVFGETGAGKSYFAASLPRPLMAIDCGEGGIQTYLLPQEMDERGQPKGINLERVQRGEEDLVFVAQSPGEYGDLVNYALSLPWLKSLVVDPLNAQWEDHMDYYNDQFGGDIKGGQWKAVKGPWKARLKMLNRSPLNICYTAHLKDVAYEQEDGKIKDIRAQEVPQAEKNVPYATDMILQLSIDRDRLNRPKPIHVATLAKCRKPRSVPATELHVGKKWTFNAKDPKSPWDVIVAPLLPQWGDGAVDYLGMDARDAIEGERELDVAGDEQILGQITALIGEKYKDLGDYKSMFEREGIGGLIDALSPGLRAKALRLHEAKKKELGA